MKRQFSKVTIAIVLMLTGTVLAENRSQAIMVTGFWNPTGQMIAPFCTDSYLNPSGWIGKNWENRGFDLYSFFPEPGSYTGVFEVDYQNVWKDFWHIADSIKPVAIVSFGAGAGPWEIETIARNLNQWVNDYKVPRQPTPSPPDSTVSTNYARKATLPLKEIKTAVIRETPVSAWIDSAGNPGAFLCEYIAYLGMWYQSIHRSPTDPSQCQMAGFIHVSDRQVTLNQGKEATIATLREVIKKLDISSIAHPRRTDQSSLQVCRVKEINFSVTIPQNQAINLAVYSMKGKRLHTIDRGEKQAGTYTYTIKKGQLTPGSYLCHLKTENHGGLSKAFVIVK